MPVTHLPHERLLRSKGRHVASEPHLRIQVLEFKTGAEPPRPFAFHGELLLITLAGQATVRTAKGRWPLGVHDQFLLMDGEPFAVEATEQDAVVQFVWTPGPNPCPTCERS